MSDKVPRLEFDELDRDLADALRPRVERLKYLGEFFKVMGHNPEVLRPFMEMTEALKAALPENLTEVGALTVAGALGNDYERHQHERLCEKLGFARCGPGASTRTLGRGYPAPGSGLQGRLPSRPDGSSGGPSIFGLTVRPARPWRARQRVDRHAPQVYIH